MKTDESFMMHSVQKEILLFEKRLEESENLVLEKLKFFEKEILENKADIRALQCQNFKLRDQLYQLKSCATEKCKNSKERNLIIHVDTILYRRSCDFIQTLFVSYLKTEIVPVSVIFLKNGKNGFTSLLVRFKDVEEKNIVLRNCLNLKSFPGKISICEDKKRKVYKNSHQTSFHEDGDGGSSLCSDDEEVCSKTSGVGIQKNLSAKNLTLIENIQKHLQTGINHKFIVDYGVTKKDLDLHCPFEDRDKVELVGFKEEVHHHTTAVLSKKTCILFDDDEGEEKMALSMKSEEAGYSEEEDEDGSNLYMDGHTRAEFTFEGNNFLRSEMSSDGSFDEYSDYTEASLNEEEQAIMDSYYNSTHRACRDRVLKEFIKEGWESSVPDLYEKDYSSDTQRNFSKERVKQQIEKDEALSVGAVRRLFEEERLANKKFLDDWMSKLG